MSQPLLLDTCAVIWIAEDSPISDEAVTAMDEAYDAGRPVYVSPITAWEIGVLAAREQWVSALPPARWFERFLSLEAIELTALSPQILIAASFLPGPTQMDSADRILAATAREQGLTLITRDRNMLDYAAHGHLLAIAC